jgi:GNAT superfamily N-acetyltransferase
MNVRIAERGDIAAMHRVRMAVRENRLASTTLSEADYVEHIEVLGRGWVVIDVGGDIVGFAIANARDGNIWALFVHPDHERRGYGRRLHDEIVRWLWSRGLDRLWLTTEPETRARRFYEAAGWTARGTTEHGELRFELDRPL